MENTNEKVNNISMMVGYNKLSYFCRSFREYYGISPEKHRTNGGTIDAKENKREVLEYEIPQKVIIFAYYGVRDSYCDTWLFLLPAGIALNDGKREGKSFPVHEAG